MKNKRIIGVDPGSRVSGLACIEHPLVGIKFKDIKIIDMLSLETKDSNNIITKVGQLHEAFYTLFQQHSPDVCVLEKCFVGRNPQSALKLGLVRGACICAASRLNISILELAPTSIKKTIAGNGHASKTEIAIALETLLSRKISGACFDASDALAIAVSSIFYSSNSYKNLN